MKKEIIAQIERFADIAKDAHTAAGFCMSIADAEIKGGEPEWRAIQGVYYANVQAAKDACRELADILNQLATDIMNGDESMLEVAEDYKAAVTHALLAIMSMEFTGSYAASRLVNREKQAAK